MIAQEICLVSEPGAGAHYMDMYDQLPTTIRYRLKECTTNICICCLVQNANNHHDEREFHHLIDLFEAGDYDAITNRRAIQDTRRSYEEDRFRRVYGNPYDPAIDVEYFKRSFRDYDYLTRRSLQQGMEWRRGSYDDSYAGIYEAPTTTARFLIDAPRWIGMDIAKATGT